MSDDYHSIIAPAVSRLPNKTDEARTAIYERARAALRETLHNYDPPLSETEKANVQSSLDTAIGAVEVDFLVAAMRHAREEPAPSPFEIKLYSKGKGVRTFDSAPHWLKVKNPNAPAVTREAEED